VPVDGGIILEPNSHLLMYITTLSGFQIQHKFWVVYVTRILIMVYIMMPCIINSP